MSKRPILLLGANGQLGHVLQSTLAALGSLVALRRSDADLTRPSVVRSIVRRHEPRIIVNAAAYTAVDRAEKEQDLAHAINGEAPGVIAEEAQELEACFVHYSTDYVFDGLKQEPYFETDPTNPLSTYGRSKLAGEDAVRRNCERHLILRTSWVFGAYGRNFVKTVLRAAFESATLRVVVDQCGAPTSTRLLANVTCQLVDALQHSPSNDPRWGLFHLVAGGETTWHGFARHIIERGQQLGMPINTSPESIVPITTAEFRADAPRPANSRLSTAKVRTHFGITLPDWSVGAEQVLNELRLKEIR